MFKRCAFVAVVCFLTVISTSVGAANVNVYKKGVPGEFVVHRGHRFRRKCSDKKVQDHVMAATVETVRIVLDHLDFLDDVNLSVSVSVYEIEGINGFAYFDKKTASHHIVLARHSESFTAVANTLIHELGHVFQKSKGIDLDFYNRIVYREYAPSVKTDWRHRLGEEFAEDFKICIINKYYQGMTTTKNTYRAYNDRFMKTYRREIK